MWSLGIKPTTFSLLTQCSTTEPHRNTSGVTLNADLEPKAHHQTPMNFTYAWVQSFHTLQNCCNRGGNTIFNYMDFFVATVWKCLFSLLKKGCVPVFCHIMMYKLLVFGDEFLAQGLYLKSHQKELAGIRTCFLQTSQVLPHWLNHHFSDPCLIHRYTVML